jgi:hypothetical protein
MRSVRPEGAAVKVTCVHPGGIKTAVARNATVANDQNAQTFAEFFEQAAGNPFARNGRRDHHRWSPQRPRPGSDRLGGEGSRCAGSNHRSVLSADHRHSGGEILSLGEVNRATENGAMPTAPDSQPSSCNDYQHRHDLFERGARCRSAPTNCANCVACSRIGSGSKRCCRRHPAQRHLPRGPAARLRRATLPPRNCVRSLNLKGLSRSMRWE